MKTVTAGEMKEIERRAAEGGLDYYNMMENAGTAAANALLENVPHFNTAVIFAGKGNNGGDALVVARKLGEKNIAALVILAENDVESSDGKINLAKVRMAGIPVHNLTCWNEKMDMFLGAVDAVVDGVYGTGFHGKLNEDGKKVCALINRGKYVMALDLPSGVSADTGEVADGAVKANLTVTFHAAKPCHEKAVDNCGKIIVADIGIKE